MMTIYVVGIGGHGVNKKSVDAAILKEIPVVGTGNSDLYTF